MDIFGTYVIPYPLSVDRFTLAMTVLGWNGAAFISISWGFVYGDNVHTVEFSKT
jgi:hypothetical protein